MITITIVDKMRGDVPCQLDRMYRLGDNECGYGYINEREVKDILYTLLSNDIQFVREWGDSVDISEVI